MVGQYHSTLICLFKDNILQSLLSEYRRYVSPGFQTFIYFWMSQSGFLENSAQYSIFYMNSALVIHRGQGGGAGSGHEATPWAPTGTWNGHNYCSAMATAAGGCIQNWVGRFSKITPAVWTTFFHCLSLRHFHSKQKMQINKINGLIMWKRINEASSAACCCAQLLVVVYLILYVVAFFIMK